ncbi:MULTISPECIES: cytochrome c [unclassified Paraburkholderia]|uniref:c-type cytochrome n=1 Tax=unclassified Paraburkholderia TaxID=2615204 RepID=UPI002AAF7165|nr:MULTISPECIES: cytochrome c [unclassified Paraburkholderia]
MRKLTVAIAAAVVVVGGLWAGSLIKPSLTIDAQALSAPGNAAHGEYLARAGDCMACHTSKGGAPFAGGVPLSTPLGAVYSTNITPDKTHGIGNWSFEDFALAMREGVTPGGRHLYPAMPYTSYAKVSDSDLRDLYAYFTSGVSASPQPNQPADIPWPLDTRWPLAYWNRVFHDDTRYKQDSAHSVEWNRGAYLVQGLAHCGTCHTPRGVGFQELDLDGSSARYLSGARIDGSSPVNLRADKGTGLGEWNEADIVALLKTGRTAHSAVTGPMGEVVEHSTQYLSDIDLHAIAVYLKSLTPLSDEAGAPAYKADDATLTSIMTGHANDVGARIYMDSCAACHRQNGEGAARVFPSLANNPSVLAKHPDSLIAVILAGSRLPSTASAPAPLAMPPFAWRYDDDEIAQLATFVRTAWGNDASAVTASDVKRVRNQMGIEAKQ